MIIILLCIDIASKQAALNLLTQGTSQSFIPFIDLFLTFNSGVAFGFLDFGERLFSNILMVVGILIFLYLLYLLKEESTPSKKNSTFLYLWWSSRKYLRQSTRWLRN